MKATTLVWRMACGVALLSLAAGCTIDISADDYKVAEERVFKLDGGSVPDIELSTFDGSVEVRSWDRAEVKVEVEKRGANKDVVDAIVVAMVQDGNRVRVEARPSQTGGWMGQLVTNVSHSARIVATVPRKCGLRVRSGDGSVRVDGVTGQVDVETEDGSVRGAALAGEVLVRSGDGSVKLDTIDGRVVAQTDDGSIVLSGRLNEVSAKTGDGSISIRADIGSEADADWDVSTSDGSIAIELPEDFSAEVDASTHDGVVRAERSLGLPSDDARKGSVRGRLGSGGRTIKVRSGDGSISLRRI